jgi:hypothetical protein
MRAAPWLLLWVPVAVGPDVVVDAARGGTRASSASWSPPPVATLSAALAEAVDVTARAPLALPGDRWALADTRRDAAVAVDPGGVTTLQRADGRALTLAVSVDGVALAPARVGLGRCVDEAVSLTGECARELVIDRGAVVEWWRGGEALEQGWTVWQGPAAGPLRLRLGVDGETDGRTASAGAFRVRALRAWDAAGTPLEARFEGGDGLAVVVETDGAAWPVTVDPLWEGALWWGEARASGVGAKVRVAAAGDVDGDGSADLVLSGGFRGGPRDINWLSVMPGDGAGFAGSPAWSVALEADDEPFELMPVGDMNGDGLGDVLAHHEGLDRATVWLGGAGGLTAAVDVVPEVLYWHPQGEPLAGDVDGDGLSDLVWWSGAAATQGLWWLRGDVAGPSGPARVWEARDGQTGAIGELTGDGRADVVLLLDPVLVVPGTASGLDVGAALRLPSLGEVPLSAAVVGDLDGDGAADLVVGTRIGLHSWMSATLAWVTSPLPSDQVVALRGDTTGDGVPDLLERRGRIARVLEGAPDGTWTPGTGEVTTEWTTLPVQPGDVDGDGLVDRLLVTPYGPVLLPGGVELDAGLDLAPLWTWASSGVSLVGVGDLSGDGVDDLGLYQWDALGLVPGGGRFDLLAGGPGGPARTSSWTLLGDGVGSLVPEGRVGDLTGDGVDDLLVGGADYRDTTATLALYAGGAQPTAPVWTLTGEGAERPGDSAGSPGDVNGDGWRDLVVTRGPSTYRERVVVELYLGTPGGLEGAPAWRSEDGLPEIGTVDIAGGDFDGDGFRDAAIGPTSDGLTVLRGGVDPFLTRWAVGVDPGGYWVQLAAVGDVDADGFDDLAVTEASPEGLAGLALLRGAPGGFVPGGDIARSERAGHLVGESAIGAGDTNCDGRADLLVSADGAWGERRGGGLYVGRPGGFSEAPAWVGPGAAYGLGPAGDVDGDGCADLLAGDGDVVSLWYGGPTAPAPESCAGRPDLDGDGVCDVADRDDGDPTRCGDADGDGCEDCASGTFDVDADGPDADGDGWCDAGDWDDDGDGGGDLIDPAPLDPTVCGDVDADGCDDCSSGRHSFTDDGDNHDGDGICDLTDPDDDDDGVPDGLDADPHEASVCGVDLDGDGCMDCGSGGVDVLADGPDPDGDGRCAAGDPFERECLRGATQVEGGEVEAEGFGSHVAGVGDVDGDGLVDVLVTSLGRNRYYDDYSPPVSEIVSAAWLVPGHGGPPRQVWQDLEPPRAAGGRGDADGDGVDDLLVVSDRAGRWGGSDYLYAEGGVVGLLRGGALTEVWRWVVPEFERYSRQVDAAWLGDLNGDGRDDFAVVDSDNYGPRGTGTLVSLWFGAVDGVVEGPSWHTTDVHAGRADTPWDVDGDGLVDLVLVAERGELWVAHGVAGGLDAPVRWGAVVAPDASVSRHADVDGDGLDDLVVGPVCAERSGTSTWTVRFGAPGGVGVGRADASWSGPRCSTWTLADVDADGAADLVVARASVGRGHSGEGLVWVHRGGPAGVAETPTWTFDPNRSGARVGRSIAVVNGPAGPTLWLGADPSAWGATGRGQVLAWPLGALMTTVDAPDTLWREAEARLGTWLLAADINGDGAADLLLDGAAGTGVTAAQHLGGAGGPSAAPDAWFGDGAALAAAGDVDGDGYDDLVGSVAGTSVFWFGGPDGVDPARTDQRPGVLQLLGDVDGDGRADLFGTPERVHTFEDPVDVVLHHARGGVGWAESVVSLSPVGGFWIWDLGVSAVGDLDGDGYADLGVVERELPYDWEFVERSVAHWHRGGPGGLAGTASWQLAAIGSEAPILAPAGDVNADGYGDLLVSESAWVETFELAGAAFRGGARGRVSLFLGGPSGPGASAAWSARGEAVGGRYGARAIAVGDMDGDGFGEVAVGGDGTWGDGGAVVVYRGTASGLEATPWWSAPCDLTGGRFAAGDLDGDGLADLVVATGAAGQGGRVHLIYGAPDGPRAEPGIASPPPDTGLGETDLAETDAVETDVDTDADTDVDTDVDTDADTDAAETDVDSDETDAVETDVDSDETDAVETDVDTDAAETDAGGHVVAGETGDTDPSSSESGDSDASETGGSADSGDVAGPSDTAVTPSGGGALLGPAAVDDAEAARRCGCAAGGGSVGWGGWVGGALGLAAWRRRRCGGGRPARL